MVHPDLVELVRCPKCLGTLTAKGEDGLECAACHVVYPVVDDIPQLLVEEARPASP